MGSLTLRGITKQFGTVPVLHGIDLDIEDGEFTVFVGPSGCGKSTLLRLIAGLDEISGGDLSIDGERINDVAPAKRGIAMVFQSYALYPHMSVYENMAFGLKLAGMSKADVDKRVKETAETLQLTPLLDRRPRELSGGQRQRVAIGRAIVRSPRVFLFDEPLSNLDAALRVQMRFEIARLKVELGVTMIYVTHDQVEAMTLADKIVVMNGGRVEQVGSPLDLYEKPANLFVAGFIGSPKMNFLAGKVIGVSEGAAQVEVAGLTPLSVPVSRMPQPGSSVTLGIRPEHLLVGEGVGSVWSGRALVVERLGGETYLHMTGPGTEPLVLRQPGTLAVKVGEGIAVTVLPAACHLFDAEGKVL
ncbi:ABC transporter ATP-binding protein [Lacibacterium aquatile]|uniref:ABC transporter ATP-binding protein n=1 Tax=Lacibacterium aquatile TaxID=1168082 RepID=A0ABW5DQ01_9PROT